MTILPSILDVTTLSDAFLLGSPTTATAAIAPATTVTNAFPNAKDRTPLSPGMTTLSIPRGGERGQGINTRMKAAASGTADSGNEESAEKSNELTIAMATFNLIKGCVGSGVLSLPAGVAAIGDVRTA